mmetsp:Transcript_32446/g.71410  ORF Transcript_32446/g.71410 Transcript_32446/m.71410 type:complete len:202 (+) Transcript_32446:2-607(+)
MFCVSGGGLLDASFAPASLLLPLPPLAPMTPSSPAVTASSLLPASASLAELALAFEFAAAPSPVAASARACAHACAPALAPAAGAPTTAPTSTAAPSAAPVAIFFTCLPLPSADPPSGSSRRNMDMSGLPRLISMNFANNRNSWCGLNCDLMRDEAMAFAASASLNCRKISTCLMAGMHVYSRLNSSSMLMAIILGRLKKP